MNTLVYGALGLVLLFAVAFITTFYRDLRNKRKRKVRLVSLSKLYTSRNPSVRLRAIRGIPQPAAKLAENTGLSHKQNV